MRLWFGLSFLAFCAAVLVFAFRQQAAMNMPSPEGMPFPAMTQLEEAGAPNPPYMVNLFASWCTPCLAELPYLKQWKEASGLPVIGIAWKDDPEKLQQWVERHAPPFDVIYEDTEGRATAPLAIKGLPVSYLVDKDGVIRGMHAGAVTASDVTELTKILR